MAAPRLLTGEAAAVGEGGGGGEEVGAAVGPPRRLGLAVAVAPDEDGEAAVGVAVGLQLRRELLLPPDGPVSRPTPTGHHPPPPPSSDATITMSNSLSTLSSSRRLRRPPRRRVVAAERDGVRLPEPGRKSRKEALVRPAAAVGSSCVVAAAAAARAVLAGHSHWVNRFSPMAMAPAHSKKFPSLLFFLDQKILWILSDQIRLKK